MVNHHEQVIDWIIWLCIVQRFELSTLHLAVALLWAVRNTTAPTWWYETALACLHVAEKYHVDRHRGIEWYVHVARHELRARVDAAQLAAIERTVLRAIDWRIMCIDRQTTWYTLQTLLTTINSTCVRTRAQGLATVLLLVPNARSPRLAQLCVRYGESAGACGTCAELQTEVGWANDAIALGHVFNGAVRALAGAWPEPLPTGARKKRTRDCDEPEQWSGPIV